MDIFVSKLTHIIPFAVIAMMVIALFVFGSAVIRTARFGQHDPVAKRLAYFWMSLAVPFFLLVAASMLLSHFSTWHKFNSIMAQKPNRLAIISEGKTNQINDAVVIADLYRIITRSKKVSAHHSHTVSDVQLLFPQTGYSYSLRRDSQYSNEFWFGWSGIAGRERDWLDVGASLGQLRSDELASWVEKHTP